MRQYYFIVLLIIHSSFALSQDNFIRFQHLTVKDGLSQGHILCMIQDSEGYIWVGTYNGLNRYNGYTFDVFHADRENPNSLFINAVYSLFEDRDGNIWCGTWGVDLFNRKTGGFTHITAEAGENTLSAGEISSIKQDRQGIMWFATQGGGLNKYNPKTKKITYFNRDNNKALKSDYINDILIDHEQQLWIATEDGGLSRMNLKDESIITYNHIYGVPASVPSNKVTCIFEDRQGRRWFGDAEGHLFVYNESADSFKTYDALQSDKGFKRSRIMQIVQDWNGNLLLASNGAGLILFNYKSEKSKLYLHNDRSSGSLISNETYSLLIDKANTVFIGSYGRGISRFSPYNSKFDVHIIPESDAYPGDINAFTDCIEDSLGHLIAGTYYGFVVYDKKTWTFRHFLPGNSYEGNKMLTLKLGPDGSIWISSVSNLYRYDRNFNKIQSYVLDPALRDHSVYAIEFDYLNNMWIGLFTKGLMKIPEQEWRNSKKTNLNYKLYLSDYNDTVSVSGNQQWVIYNDKDSNLWIGGVGGLNKYNYESDNFTRVFNPGTIKSIDFDSKGKIWMGTIGEGLFSYDLTTKNYKRYTLQDGLGNSFIYGIVIDSSDNIWISTESGLSRFNIETAKFRNYDILDGLPDDHFDDKSATKLSDGRIYMGTNRGFTIFQPEKIKDDTSRSKVVLSSLQINNHWLKFYKTRSKGSAKYIPIGQLSKIRLKPYEKDITFEFAALLYSAPYKIHYSYMLSGYDKEWLSTGSDNRLARYTNLDGGDYRFLVKAANSDGQWTGEPLEINIIVVPPFYKTAVFRLMVAVLLLVLMFLAFKWRLGTEVRQKKKLAKLVDQRTIELSKKNEELEKNASNLQDLNSLMEERQQQIEEQKEKISVQKDALVQLNATKDKLFSVIAHDLKNPFNVILGYSDLLLSRFDIWDDEKKHAFLLLLKDSAKGAYSLLENLLQWSRSQSGIIRFDPVPRKACELVELVIREVANYAKKKEIEIIRKFQDDDIVVLVDTNMLCTVLRNLLVNAVKFSKKGDIVTVSVNNYNVDCVVFSISDNGVGICSEDKEKIFNLQKGMTTTGTDGEKGTGIGLILCKDFVEHLKGKIWVESELDKGTTFYFTVPRAVKLN